MSAGASIRFFRGKHKKIDSPPGLKGVVTTLKKSLHMYR